MRALGALAGSGFRRYASYRAATMAGAFTNSVFGLLRAAITLAAISSAGGSLGGYTASSGSTYVWLAQALIGPVMIFTWTELAERIRTGDIATDLTRPVDLQLGMLAADLGRAVYVLIPRGLPPLLVGAATFGLAMPHRVMPYLLGVLSTILAVTISFGCRFVTNLAGFWLLDVRGVNTLYLVASNVLCGLVVSVHWFPGWLAALAAATPFPSMLQTPIDILSGRSDLQQALDLLGVQCLWLVGVLLLGRIVLARATRKLVVQGG